jgi:hypothetical protein
MAYRILVCGGRDFNDRKLVFSTLWTLDPRPSRIIQGGASGADSLAREWAASNFIFCEHYPANWKLHGNRAGPIRNQQMIDEGRPDLVIAFPGGRGTADMINRARLAGVPVREITRLTSRDERIS